ncbi:MAG: ABC transporter ATP-binding protein [Thermoflexales bacterium]|nr:ABC transporter ATP-binding protein [Thermoflexales bacterium]MCX7939244.1 ABC transporter ATP-binding protein [Thermoflexales bacterium]MDW8291875.1 ABC transporter ATP-binding protein [Anaerolineae bacterium]
MSLLVAEDVTHVYPNGVEALRRFSLQVQPGERVAIVGPSGCGKSTLLRVLAGLLRPTEGRVCFKGRPVEEPNAAIGLMFQEPTLLPWRTVLQNVTLPLEMRALRGRRALDPSALLQEVGLSGFEHAKPHTLSGGMAQRVALARALITAPPLLLLDEPFGALDALTRESLTALVDRLATRFGMALVMVTHDIGEAIFIADRVIVSSARPGHPVGEVRVPLARPRVWAVESEPAFGYLVARVRELLAEGSRDGALT